MARQVVIDQERQRVVEAYRALKAEKMQSWQWIFEISLFCFRCKNVVFVTAAG